MSLISRVRTIEKHDQSLQVMGDAVFTYDKIFKKDHTFNAMAGMNYTQSDDYNLQGSGSLAPTDYIRDT